MNALKKREFYVYGALAVVLVAVFALTVRSGTDLIRLSQLSEAQASGQGFWDVLQNLYDTSSGRVLADALHVFLLTQPLLDAVVRAAVVLGLVWAIAQVTALRTFAILPVLTLAVMVPSVSLLRQAVLWSAGFYTAVLPVLLILLIVVIYRSERVRFPYVYIVLLAFAASLCMEALTLALCVGSIALMVVAFARNRFSLKEVAVFVGAVLGTFVMFASPAYREVLASQGARASSVELVPATAAPVANGAFADLSVSIAKLGIEGVSAVAVICAVFAVAVSAQLWRSVRNTRVKLAMLVMLSAAAAMLLVAQVGVGGVSGSLSVLIGFGLCVAGAVFAVAAFTALWFSGHARGREAALWLGVAVVSVLPYAAIARFGPKNFYAVAIALGVALLLICGEQLRAWVASVWVQRVALSAAGAFAAALLAMLSLNAFVAVQNQNSAAEQLQHGAGSVELRQYPFPELVEAWGDTAAIAEGLQEFECFDGSCYPALEGIEIILK